MDPVSDPAGTEPDPVPEAPLARRRRGLITVLAALIIALFLRVFVVQVFFIPSDSMEPTLEIGDRILVCRVCTSVGGVQRGDVIVFGDPSSEEDVVKRVVGLPGEVVELRDGVAYVDGIALDEPYLDPVVDTRPFGPLTVPDEMLFVLGDNRIGSGDSRFEPPLGVGLVPQDVVVGEVVATIWPPSQWGSV